MTTDERSVVHVLPCCDLLCPREQNKYDTRLYRLLFRRDAINHVFTICSDNATLTYGYELKIGIIQKLCIFKAVRK
jgi:hypothetical protein